MTGFTKLFSTIVTSSIWSEDDQTRIVWITMLALADQNGVVAASVPGLAKVAGVPIAATERALETFLAPDQYSRTKDDDGRRIEEIDGGWRLLNHTRYREARNEDERKAYRRAWMQAKRAGEREQRVNKREQREQNVNRREPKQKQSTDTDVLTDVGANGSPPASKGVESDSDWLKELEVNPAYRGLCVALEFGKMKAWCEVNNKKPTRRRFINWLNRADRPMDGGQSRPAISPGAQAMIDRDELQRCSDEIRRIRGQYDSHQDMTDKEREKVRALRSREKELKAKLGVMI